MPKSIDKRSPVPIYRQVKDYLLEKIRDDESLQLIPPEVELGRRFGISRATVRAAILELVSEGVLRRVPGKGTFVNRRTRRLVFTSWLGQEEFTAGALAELVERFQQEARGLEIEQVGIPYPQTEHQLMLMTTAGKAPDIATLIYLWIPIFAHQGALHPLEEVYTPELKADLFPRTLDAVRYRGHYYGLNWINAPNILYFNKRILGELLGQERPQGESYDELLECFIRLHERSRGSIIPFALPRLDDELFFLYSIYTFLHSFGGGVVSPEGEVFFHSEANIRAYRWLREFIRRGHVDLSQEYMETRRSFAFERQAFAIEGPWLRGIIPTLNAAFRAQDLGCALLPKGPTGVRWSVLWNHTLSIFRQCADKEAALRFARFLTSNPASAELYYRRTHMLPAQRSLLAANPVYNDEFGRLLQEQMQTAFPIPCSTSPAFMISVTFCAKASREILLGEADIPATLRTYAELFKELYKR